MPNPLRFLAPRPWALASLALAVAACGPSGGGGAAPTPPGATASAKGSVINRLGAQAPLPGKSLLAMYVIGSDLEDRGTDHPDGGPLNARGAASADFRELFRGLSALTEAERAQVDLLIMFGGSRQEGWRSARLLDTAGFMKDMVDAYVGNAEASTYLKTWPEGMASTVSWEAFLKEVQARQPGHPKVFVDVWNHGASWLGVGPNTVTGATLAVDQLRSGLASTQFQGELIGFDACLMGSVEVAGAMAPHFKWLLASEELEPGHGWQYESLIRFLGQKPDAGLPSVAQAVVDDFVTHPAHRNTHGKTLSLVDLQAFQRQLAPSLEGLSQAMAAPSFITEFGLANQMAQRYGVHNNVEMARDLGGILAELKRGGVYPAGPLGASLQGLEASVRYAREDGTKPLSQGLSLFSLGNAGDFNQGYLPDRAFPKRFHDTLTGWFEAANQDQQPPEWKAVDAQGLGAPAFRLLQAPVAALRVSDDVCVTEVGEMHAVLIDRGFELVGSAPAQAWPGQKGVYRQARWDGRSFRLSTGGASAALSTTQELGEGGLTYHSAPILLNAEPATLVLEVQGEQVQKLWVQVYQENGEPAREQHELVDGDLIEPLKVVYDAQKDEVSVEGGVALRVKGQPELSLQRVAGDAVAFLLAKDLRGNLNVSEPITP